MPVPLSWNLGTLNSCNPLGHYRPVTGLIYLYLTLRQVHRLYQSEFSTKCELALSISISIILSFSLRSFSSCLRLLPRFPITFILSSISPSITCFRRRFLRKVWTILLAFLLFMYVWNSRPPRLFVTLLHFSYDRSKWPSQSFSSTTFQNFPYTRISRLLSEVSKFQHQTKLYSKRANGAFL